MGDSYRRADCRLRRDRADGRRPHARGGARRPDRDGRAALQTTSSVAAAIWYPYKAYPEDRVLSWGSETFEIFEELLHLHERAACACAKVEIWPPVPDPGGRSGARRPPVHRIALPPGYTDGHAFVAPVIEMPVYLGYLMDRFVGSGGRVEHRAVSSLEEAGEGRCRQLRGARARELVGDPSMKPIRGQIVRAQPRPRAFRARRREPGRRNLRDPTLGRLHPGRHGRRRRVGHRARPADRGGHPARCVALEPRLAEAEVLEHKVGLRPGRPEIRLEIEDVSRARRASTTTATAALA